MTNLFEGINIRPESENADLDDEQRLKVEKREEMYRKYDPMVNEMLDMLLAAHKPGLWKKASDCERLYCCHIAWFVGPEEKFTDPYDVNHKIRRRIEVKLEMDGFCNPTGFRVTNYETITRTIHVGLEKGELMRGIKAVLE